MIRRVNPHLPTSRRQVDRREACDAAVCRLPAATPTDASAGDGCEMTQGLGDAGDLNQENSAAKVP